MKRSKWPRWMGSSVFMVALSAAIVWAAPPVPAEDIAEQCISEIQQVAGTAVDEISFSSFDCSDAFAALAEAQQPASKYFVAASKCVASAEKLSGRAQTQINKVANKCIGKLDRAEGSQLLIDAVEDARSEALQIVQAEQFLESEQIHTSLGSAVF